MSRLNDERTSLSEELGLEIEAIPQWRPEEQRGRRRFEYRVHDVTGMAFSGKTKAEVDAFLRGAEYMKERFENAPRAEL